MTAFDVDLEYIERLAELLERTGLTEIELEQGDAKLRVAREAPRLVEVAAHPQPGPAPAPAPAPAAVEPAKSSEDNWAEHPGVIASPIVGTAYLRPEPSAEPFAKVGDSVDAGQTLLIVEAMKVMNPIRATAPGRVVKILVEDAAPVEFGEPLVVIE